MSRFNQNFLFISLNFNMHHGDFLLYLHNRKGCIHVFPSNKFDYF